MNETRGTPGNSTWYDNRKKSERNGGIWFKKTRHDMKQIKLLGINLNELEEFISYPYMDDGHELCYDVKYFENKDVYMVKHHELVKKYKFMLMQLLLSTKYNKNQDLQKWIDHNMEQVNHEYPWHTAAWLKYPTEENKNDRVVIITGYHNEGAWCFKFMQEYIPKYYVQHINHKTIEIETNYTISSHLANGEKLQKGGEGLASDSDISIIIIPTNNSTPYNYLIIQIFIKNQQILSYKNHCKAIGHQEIGKISHKLESWRTPRFKDREKSDFIDIAKEIKDKEFELYIKSKLGASLDWRGTKNRQITTIDYEDSIKIFGGGAIVKTFRPKNGTSFILSIIDLVLTYYPNKGRMKLECFVKHLWK